MTSQTVSDSILPGEPGVQAFVTSMITRALGLIHMLSQRGYPAGKSQADVVADAHLVLQLEALHPLPFQSSRQNSIQSSNAPETTTARTYTSWTDRLQTVCALFAGRRVVAVADYCRSIGMKMGPVLLRDVLIGAISIDPEFMLEDGRLPGHMPAMKPLFQAGYKARCSQDVPQRVLQEFDDFMAARSARKQIDIGKKEWKFSEMCEEADPVGTVFGWRARLPPTHEEDIQPSTPALRCEDYSYMQAVAIIGRPGQHSTCDCRKGRCKFHGNPNQLRIVALGRIRCSASRLDSFCSCLQDQRARGNGVRVRVIRALKHGQTHPEPGDKGATTKVLLCNSGDASGDALTPPLTEHADVWCPDRLVYPIDDDGMRALMPKRGRKAKDKAEEGEEEEEGGEDSPPPPEAGPEVPTRRSTRQRTERRNDDEIMYDE